MRTLPCGKPISALGFGCSSIWAKPSFPAERAARILDVAVENGINHFDTGPSYADGEERLGTFLAGHDPSRFVLSTKVGTEHGDGHRSFDRARMASSFAASLARLRLAAVDILYLHGPALADLSASSASFFAARKTEGTIRYAGVNSFDPEVVEACVVLPWVEVVMLQYSVSDRRFDGLIDRLTAAGKVVIAGTIMAQGIFDLRTFVPRDAKSLWYLLRQLKNDPLFALKGRRLARRIGAAGLRPHEAAVRFAVSNDRITSNLFGTSSPDHVIANAALAEQPLSDAQCRALIGRGKAVAA